MKTKSILDKKFYLCIICGLLLSCNFESNDFSGTWVNVDDKISMMSSKNISDAKRIKIQIEKDKLIFYGLNYSDPEIEPVTSANFFRRKKSTIYEDKYFNRIDIIEKSDSTIVLDFLKDDLRLLFLKLSPVKQIVNWNPKFKSYTSNINDEKYYYDFINDSVLINYIPKKKQFFFKKWLVEDFNNLSFMVIDNNITSTEFIIDSIKKTEVYLSDYKYNENIILKQTKEQKINSNFLGKWMLDNTKFVELNSRNASKITKELDESYHIDSMKFTNDSVILVKMGVKEQKKYKLLSGGRLINFLDNTNQNKDEIWIVDHIDDNSFRLIMNNLGEDYSVLFNYTRVLR